MTRSASGNIATEAVSVPTGAVPSRSRTFGYDGAGRLTSVAETTGAGTTTRNYAYDADSNRCATATACNGTWVYDAADRLVSSPYASAHTYDSHGNLTAATLVPGATGAGAEVLTYDANDHALTVNDGTITTDETLDPAGRVLRRVVRTNATGVVSEDVLYGYDGSGDSPAYTLPAAAGPVTTYVSGPRGLVAIDVGGTVTYPVVDGHGDIVGNTDAAGAFTAVSLADEFGRGPTPASRLGWLGSHQRYSTGGGLGLVRMGVRLYDPALGRFLETDPVEGGSCTDYDYVCADPINSLDLDGQVCVFSNSKGCIGIGDIFKHGKNGAKQAKKRATEIAKMPAAKVARKVVKAAAACYGGYKLGRVAGTGIGLAASPWLGPEAVPIGGLLGGASGCTVGASWSLWGPPGFNPLKDS